jgi:hypothetical protein
MNNIETKSKFAPVKAMWRIGVVGVQFHAIVTSIIGQPHARQLYPWKKLQVVN